MVANEGGGGAGAAAGLTNLIQPTAAECCMCGDYGLSQELFRCKICKSRFQHKYCSNQYPHAELYKACNWCLTQKHDSGNSSNSWSSSCRNDSGRDHTVRNKRNPDDRIGHRGLRRRMKASEMELTSKGLIQKLHQTSPEEKSPASTARKRVGGAVVVVEDEKRVMLRKSKSASHLSHGGGIRTKPLLRNKVRRYKLLDEVTSQ